MTRKPRLLAPLAPLALGVLVAPAIGSAQPVGAEDGWQYVAADGAVAIDGSLAVGFPAALPTGLSRGVGIGVTGGRWLAWGLRAAWTSATESSEAFEVHHHDVRLRAVGGLQHVAGRGTLALQLGLGGTLVRERRTRHQGMRAGLEGDELETTGLALLPLASVEAVVGLHVRGPWSLRIAGGPTVSFDDGIRGGWTAEIGVAWLP